MTATINCGNQGQLPIEYSKQATTMPSGRYSLSFSQFAAKLSRYALPIITFAAMASIPVADAGPISYAACVLGCSASAPPAIPLCVTMCGVVLFFPSP